MCNAYRYMYGRDGIGSVAPPPENTQSGGYRSSAAGSSPDGLSSRLTVALMRRIRTLTCCNRILTAKVHCFMILEGDVAKWQGLRHISKKKGSQHNCEP
jgi:hypothetical protein